MWKLTMMPYLDLEIKGMVKGFLFALLLVILFVGWRMWENRFLAQSSGLEIVTEQGERRILTNEEILRVIIAREAAAISKQNTPSTEPAESQVPK